MSETGEFVAALRRRLQQPLPGRAAQRRFAPELAYGRHHGPPEPDFRSAAVIALFYRDREQWRLPLTLRPAHMSDHAGQISFPGGMLEPGESPEECALRELTEELGVTNTGMKLVGRLTPLYVFASNFFVTPVVAVSERCPRFCVNPAEVAELLELPCEQLLDDQYLGVHLIQRRGLRFRAPHIAFADHRIWGATGLMLGELGEIARDILVRWL